MSTGSSKRLAGKVEIITGVARGIGRATAHRVGARRRGHHGVRCRRSCQPDAGDELDETGRLVTEAGARWCEARLNQRDLPALRKAAEHVFATLGVGAYLFGDGAEIGRSHGKCRLRIVTCGGGSVRSAGRCCMPSEIGPPLLSASVRTAVSELLCPKCHVRLRPTALFIIGGKAYWSAFPEQAERYDRACDDKEHPVGSIITGCRFMRQVLDHLLLTLRPGQHSVPRGSENG